jgi:acyl-CoA reductase-like NAD-dependent aldehyde dehydrogenase
MTATTRTAQVFIGGRFRPAANTFPVLEVPTGEPIGAAPSARQAQIDDAVAAAHSPEADAPFGGVKASEIGRGLGPEGLDEYLCAKSIYRSGPAAGNHA